MDSSRACDYLEIESVPIAGWIVWKTQVPLMSTSYLRWAREPTHSGSVEPVDSAYGN